MPKKIPQAKIHSIGLFVGKKVQRDCPFCKSSHGFVVEGQLDLSTSKPGEVTWTMRAIESCVHPPDRTILNERE